MRVLSFAAVGFHGREWWTRPASAALALATLSIPASPFDVAQGDPEFIEGAAQPSAPFLDLAPDFASAIAAAVGPNAAASVAFAPEQQRLQVEVVRLLAARGVRVVENGEGARVSAECSTNLRERACAAEIRRGDDRRVVITTRARDRGQNADEAPVVAIELRPIYGQRRAMLDVADAGDRLLVLTPESVSLVANDAAGARSIASRPIETSRVWPRDVRGRLRVAGSAFEAFLPGVTCRGTVAPFALACADESEPWPLGLANSGIAPSRNAFSTPDGFTFYEAAALGGGRWLAVGERGVLTLVDARGRSAARADAADHLAGFPDSCAGDAPYVVADARAPDANADALRLFRVEGAHLVAMPASTPLPGTLTTLWSAPAGGAATAIVHDINAGRYEAFHVSLSCAR